MAGRQAVVDFNGFAPVLNAAVADARRLRVRNDEDLWLEIRNGEHSEAYAEHLADQHYEDGDTAETYLEIYVEALRDGEGWATITRHPHLADLLPAWISLLRADGATPSEGELAGLSDACLGGPFEEGFWELAAGKWSPDLETRLAGRLHAADLPGDVRRAVLATMASHRPEQGRQALAALARDGDLLGLLRWMVDLKALAEHYTATDQAKAFSAAAPAFAGLFENLSRLVLDGTVRALSTDDLARLEALDTKDAPDLRLIKARLLAASGRSARSLVEGLLEATGIQQEDINRAVGALSVAIDQGAWDLVGTALGHKFADVRRDALCALARREADPLPTHLLQMAADKGSGVRLALVDILKARPHADHQPALMTLIHDTWSNSDHYYYGDDADYPIAFAAAEMLRDQGPIGAQKVDVALEVATDTADPDVRWALMTAIARQGADPGLDLLTELAVEQGRPLIHAAAASALYTAGAMGPQRAQRFNKAHLLKRPANVAVNMALAVGANGELARTLALGRSLAADADRIALVVPLLFAAIGRGDDLADQLAPLLPDPLITALNAVLTGGPPMARSLMEPLGEFRVRDAVIARLPGVFEEKPINPGPLPPLA